MVITWHKTLKEVQCRDWNLELSQLNCTFIHLAGPLYHSCCLSTIVSPLHSPPINVPPHSFLLPLQAYSADLFLFSRAILCVVHCFIKLRGVQAPCSALCQVLPCPGTFCKTWWERLGSLLISFTARNGDSHFSSKTDLNNKMSHYVCSLALFFFFVSHERKSYLSVFCVIALISLA